MTCPVCGFTSGTHDASCIKDLIATTNATLSKCVNILYHQLEEVSKSYCLNRMEIEEVLILVDRELATLRAMNSEALENTGAVA